MAKAFLGETQEFSGPVPAGGYKCVIESIERGVTSENARTPNVRQYTAELVVTEPKKNAGTRLMDWFQVGTEDDPKAKQQETWNGSIGAKKLKRLLKRASVAAQDGDDEEWMDAAQGQEVCCHVTRQKDENGNWRNRVNGEYFREQDEDFVGVGELLEADAGGARGRDGRRATGAKGNGQAGAARPARKPPSDEEEAVGARPAKAKAGAEEDDEPPARKAPSAAKAKAKVEEEDDEDED